MIDLEKREQEIINGLKDFQRDTVERISSLFAKGQNRILIADEVGLGKTLIAKGVIAKTALMHKNQGDDLFKVVYICSNQNIARQNIMKLKIDPRVTVDNSGDTRLSMQHLKFFEQKNDKGIMESYVQLIPLTPATSFNVIGGSGIVQERALIYAIIKRIKVFQSYAIELETIMKNGAKSWDDWAKVSMETRVDDCDKKSGGEYLKSLLPKIESSLDDEFIDLRNDLLAACTSIRQNGSTSINMYNLIYQLRQMMAQISIDFLEPDLVIMDEFQRFRELITADEESETGILAKRFLYSGKVKTLLLSATPYKLYSTLDEIAENGGNDDHYNEFIEVMDFLFDQDKAKCNEFRIAWSDFSNFLKQLDLESWDKTFRRKKRAEELMYEGVCRTERLMVSKNGKAMIDTSKAEGSIEITENDIMAYIESDAITSALQELGSKVLPPVEYIKSSPYIFSFMEHYQLKKELRKYFAKHPEIAKLLRKGSNSWLRKDFISSYKKLPPVNARLEQLIKEAFSENSELLMWIPPSLPYYEPGGAYKNSRKFSKVLVFSAWEMVPRMIACLLSYEAERRTTGKLIEKGDAEGEGNRTYFADNRRRYPNGRLNLSMRKNEKTGAAEPGRMALLSLMYPSITLAGLFDPIEVLNANDGKVMSRKKLEAIISQRLSPLVQMAVGKYQKIYRGPADERWYWAAPVILDAMNEKGNCSIWFNETSMGNYEDIDLGYGYEEVMGKDEKSLFSEHFSLLRRCFDHPEDMELGPVPKDLVQILVLQVLGSPASCSLRMLTQDNKEALVEAMECSLIIAREIVRKFNTPEATAIVELLYGSEFSRKKVKQPDEAHWINVLKYCSDGNLQAVLDEYKHILIEAYGITDMDAVEKHEELSSYLISSLKTHTASYKIDTYNSFASNAKRSEMRMRSHFAVGFYNSRSEGKNVQRTEYLRQSFNSPFRPFVLATTSIGQEGLDFHFYCRKIVHWNLPSNPIDLEQREGRVNRYKGLAIRQNVANRYGNIKFKKDIWDEMFRTCREKEKGNQCDLVPYWYLEPGKEEGAVYIERIVPIYPFSKESAQYERLIKILSLYRVTLGQARQEELLTYIFNNMDAERLDDIQELFINLSPYYRKQIMNSAE